MNKNFKVKHYVALNLLKAGMIIGLMFAAVIPHPWGILFLIANTLVWLALALKVVE